MNDFNFQLLHRVRAVGLHSFIFPSSHSSRIDFQDNSHKFRRRLSFFALQWFSKIHTRERDERTRLRNKIPKISNVFTRLLHPLCFYVDCRSPFETQLEVAGKRAALIVYVFSQLKMPKYPNIVSSISSFSNLLLSRSVSSTAPTTAASFV